MLSINTNLSSIIAQNSMKLSTNKLNQAIERMTTGNKINHSKDNAANYSISTNMTTKISSYNVAEDNCAMGLDLLATAEGSLNLIQDKLTRLRSLAVTAQNGTYGAQSLDALETEAESIVSEIKREYANAEYNGLKLFATAPTEITNPIATLSLTSLTEESGFIQEITRLTEEEAIADGYTIIKTADELQAITGSGKYILMNDIDLSGIEWTPISSFSGELNGNGYEISNLSVEVAAKYAGFFSSASGTIKNLGFSNANVIITGTSDAYLGIIAGQFDGDIINCYAKGDASILDSDDSSFIGGLVAVFTGDLLSSYFEGDLINNGAQGEGFASGGLVGRVNGSIDSSFVQNANFSGYDFGGLAYNLNGTISNSYISNSNFNDGGTGIVESPPYSAANNFFKVENCYVNNVTGIDYAFVHAALYNFAEIINCSAPSGMELVGSSFHGTITNSSDNLDTNNLPFVFDLINPDQSESNTGDGTGGLFLQVGINAFSSSNISIDIYFDISAIDLLLTGGLTDITCINSIDNMLNELSAKSVQYGAVQNRLESVLEEIVISRDNLISSRSTLRDADIAEVSSEYIRQQILQQASATLLATANQSPSIALQLI